MTILKRNADGTTSVIHTDEEIAAAEQANAATAEARAKQQAADTERADALSRSRAAALANVATADVEPTKT